MPTNRSKPLAAVETTRLRSRLARLAVIEDGLQRSASELANAIRALAMDAVQKADSGHPGMPMGMADIAEVLWNDFLRHSPVNPKWANRDRFILSNGHGSMLQYALLHLTGYDLPLEEIRNFRQLHSKTPGHPEAFVTPGVEATTGPLGQGTANAVGMAMAERFLAHRYNRPDHTVVDHMTWGIVSDGDLDERAEDLTIGCAETVNLHHPGRDEVARSIERSRFEQFLDWVEPRWGTGEVLTVVGPSRAEDAGFGFVASNLARDHHCIEERPQPGFLEDCVEPAIPVGNHARIGGRGGFIGL